MNEMKSKNRENDIAFHEFKLKKYQGKLENRENGIAFYEI